MKKINKISLVAFLILGLAIFADVPNEAKYALILLEFVVLYYGHFKITNFNPKEI